MQIIFKKVTEGFRSPRFAIVIKLVMIFGLMILSRHVFAADVLAGSDVDATDTMKNTGRHWLYIIECISSLGVFYKTKNVNVFFSIVAVMIFINFIIKAVGG